MKLVLAALAPIGGLSVGVTARHLRDGEGRRGRYVDPQTLGDVRSAGRDVEPHLRCAMPVVSEVLQCQKCLTYTLYVRSVKNCFIHCVVSETVLYASLPTLRAFLGAYRLQPGSAQLRADRVLPSPAAHAIMETIEQRTNKCWSR